MLSGLSGPELNPTLNKFLLLSRSSSFLFLTLRCKLVLALILYNICSIIYKQIYFFCFGIFMFYFFPLLLGIVTLGMVIFIIQNAMFCLSFLGTFVLICLNKKLLCYICLVLVMEFDRMWCCCML